MRFRLLLTLLICALFLGAAGLIDSTANAQRRAGRSYVCGDPTQPCRGVGAKDFQPFEIQFRVPRNAGIWESGPFYAIVLKSMKAGDNCELHIPESERLEAQALFPRNKVFADRCPEPLGLYYTGMNTNFRFMAVYAGTTRAEANRMLERVRATGRYAGANLRRMRAGFNGT